MAVSLDAPNVFLNRASEPMEKGTFQDSAVEVFNKLLSDIRNTKNYNDFCKKTLTFLKNRIRTKCDNIIFQLIERRENNF